MEPKSNGGIRTLPTAPAPPVPQGGDRASARSATPRRYRERWRIDAVVRRLKDFRRVANVTAADASSFRASQGQIAADMARAIDRASRNR